MMTTSTTSSITADTLASDYAAPANSANSLRPVVLTVITLKLAVAAFLVASVSISPPLSAESRYDVAGAEIVGTN